jgi:hypothetical protein
MDEREYFIRSLFVSQRLISSERSTRTACHVLAPAGSCRMSSAIKPPRLHRPLNLAFAATLPIRWLHFDLDHFRDVNEPSAIGPATPLLRQGADRVKGCVREEDLLKRRWTKQRSYGWLF